MSESYAALTVLAETPNAHARGILDKVAGGEWDLFTALGEVSTAALEAPGHEGWEAASVALDKVIALTWEAV